MSRIKTLLAAMWDGIKLLLSIVFPFGL